MKYTITTVSPEETEAFAMNIGQRLQGGEVIELIADLGGGKTTFTRGLARGAGSSDAVSSPTFTVSKVYETPKFEIHHFDFYRLNDPGLNAHELEDLVGDPSAVVVVEWADGAQHVLPENRLAIRLSAVDDSVREIHLEYESSLAYLLANKI